MEDHLLGGPRLPARQIVPNFGTIPASFLLDKLSSDVSAPDRARGEHNATGINIMTTTMATEPTLEISAPRVFTSSAVFKVCSYGLCLCFPVLAAVMIISVIPAGILTLVLPFFALAVTLYFLPFGFGNACVRKLVNSQHPARQGFVVQLRLLPSLRKGFRAVAEDADDIGLVSVDENGFSFVGDSIQCRTPKARIANLRLENCGWRGLFLYGSKITVEFDGFSKAERIELAERSSLTLPQSWRNTRNLYQAMKTLAPRDSQSRRHT
jgi:hypothetical protein